MMNKVTFAAAGSENQGGGVSAEVSEHPEFRSGKRGAPPGNKLSRLELVAEGAARRALHQGLGAVETDTATGRIDNIDIGGADQERAELGFAQREEELREAATGDVE